MPTTRGLGDVSLLFSIAVYVFTDCSMVTENAFIPHPDLAFKIMTLTCHDFTSWDWAMKDMIFILDQDKMKNLPKLDLVTLPILL